MAKQTATQSITLAETRIDGNARSIVGYAALFYDGTPGSEYVMARYSNGMPSLIERIMPSAFDRASTQEEDVVALYNHNHDMWPLGSVSADTLRLSTDRRGLRYELRVSEAPVGRDAFEAVRRRDIRGASFSFQVLDEVIRVERGVTIRELHDLVLLDVSLTNRPAYTGTSAAVRSTAQAAAGRNNDILRRRLELAVADDVLGPVVYANGDTDILRRRLALEAAI